MKDFHCYSSSIDRNDPQMINQSFNSFLAMYVKLTQLYIVSTWFEFHYKKKLVFNLHIAKNFNPRYEFNSICWYSAASFVCLLIHFFSLLHCNSNQSNNTNGSKQVLFFSFARSMPLLANAKQNILKKTMRFFIDWLFKKK